MNKIGKMLEKILKNKNISIKNVFESVLNGIDIFLSAFIKVEPANQLLLLTLYSK